MSQEQLAELNAIIRARPHFSATMAERRAGWEHLSGRFAVPDDVKYEPVVSNGVPGLWVTPPNAVARRVILYIHGGGFVLGSSRTYREFTARLGRAAKARSLVIDYRLAPENPFPAGLEDCVKAYEWLIAEGHDPKDIAVAGDSAGATLILSTLLILKSKKIPLPACIGAICGWYDLTNSSPSIVSNGNRDIFVPPNFNDAAAKIYLGGADARDPLASPLFGDMKGFPPTLIQVGDMERLIDDSTRLHAKLQAEGVESVLEIWPDMPHIWHFFGSMLDEGTKATERVAEFIAKHLR